MEDERLNSLFGEIDSDRFLALALDGPNVPEIYKEKEPTVTQFNALLENLVEPLKGQNIDQKGIDEVFKIATYLSSFLIARNEAKTAMDDEKEKLDSARYPTYSRNVLFKKPERGILERLLGTWVNYKEGDEQVYGVLTICVPSPGTHSETFPFAFNFECRNFVETLTFTPVDHILHNQGGTNEQMVGAVKYESDAIDDQGLPIHTENGMFLWLGDMYRNPSSTNSIRTDGAGAKMKVGQEGPKFIPPYKISRMGVVGHGNTVNLLGNQSGPHVGKPLWPRGEAAWAETQPEHLSISKSMGWGRGLLSNIDLDKKQPSWVFDKDLHKDDTFRMEASISRIFQDKMYPYSVRPDLSLRDTIQNQKIIDYYTIELSSDNTNGEGGFIGGITNIPFLSKYCKVPKMNFRMWIEQVQLQNGDVIDQLQYEQVIFFEFMVNETGAPVVWNHVVVNTMRKMTVVE